MRAERDAALRCTEKSMTTVDSEVSDLLGRRDMIEVHGMEPPLSDPVGDRRLGPCRVALILTRAIEYQRGC